MLFTVWAGKLTEGFVYALGGLADDVPLFAVRGNRPLSTPWYTELWFASSGVDGQLTFYGLSTAAKRPTGARVCPRQPGNRAARWKPLRALRSPESPAGTAGRGGAGEKPPTQHRTTENAPSKRGRPRAQPKPRPPEGEKAAQPPWGPGQGAAGPEARGAPQGGARDEAHRGEATRPPRADAKRKARARSAARASAARPRKARARASAADAASAAGARQRAPRPSERAGDEAHGPGETAGAMRRIEPAKRRRARPPERTSRASHSAARRQDAKRGKSPGNGAAEAGAGAQNHFVERGQSARAGTTGVGGGKIAPGTRPGAIAPTEWEPLGSWACVVQSCAAVSARLVRAAISAAQPPLYAAGKSSVMRRDSVT